MYTRNIATTIPHVTDHISLDSETPTDFNEGPGQKSERSCICVLGLSILPLSTFLIFDFGSVPTVWYFLFFFIFITVVYYKLRNLTSLE
jgi:hypothetical protein